jgi:ferredoxin
MWDASKCDLCGDCLTKCLYIDYDKEKAVAQLKLLMEGKDAEILNECITCFSCNEYCPTHADPFDLIVKMQEKTKTSPIYQKQYPDDWLDWVNKQPNELTPGDPDKPILSLGIMGPMTPKDAIGGQIFEGMPVLRGRDYYCWIGILHLCRESLLRKNIRKFIEALSKLNREIVFIHEDCYATVHYMAKDYGVDIPVKHMHIYEYLRNYLRDHKSSITKLGRKIAYQRPCVSKYTPEKEHFLDEVFELIGVERVPRKYDRENSICCSGACRMALPERADEIRERNLNDAIEYGAEAIITYCGGCDANLREAAKKVGLKPIYITNLCRMALGELPWDEK